MRDKRSLPGQVIDRMVAMRTQGKTMRAIAAEMGHSTQTVHKYTHHVNPNPDYRVTEMDRVMAVSLRNDGKTMSEIATLLGRSLATVHRLLHREGTES